MKLHLKMSSSKYSAFCSGFDVFGSFGILKSDMCQIVTWSHHYFLVQEQHYVLQDLDYEFINWVPGTQHFEYN